MDPDGDAGHVPEPDWPDLLRRFDRPDLRALALAGSFARGDPTPFSDVDLLRFTAPAAPPAPDAGSHLLGGRLVVVSDVPPEEVEAWFARPELVVAHIPGLRQARPLLDREGAFAALQARARAFAWDAALQARADAYAAREMVGWIEEVHKGLAGLQRGDVGRLLNAEFGLSWGLSRLVQVQRGMLLSGDNAFFAQVERAVGPATAWARWRRRAFGLADGGRPPSLEERVVAGLRLYVATAELLAAVWSPPAAALIEQTARLIQETLPALAPAGAEGQP